MTVSGIQGVRNDINEALNKIREASHRTEFGTNKNTISKEQPFSDVLSMLGNGVNQVNTIQNDAEVLKNQFILGDKHVSMSQVIVASQKSKLAFEGLVAVRNKILEAYKEVMNMPI